MILLDTNIISAMRRMDRHPRVAAWAASFASGSFFLSAISVMELERGVERLRERDRAQARILDPWLNAILTDYNDRILPLTTAIARRWGLLAHRIGNNSLDLAIAATALEHGLTVATRNVTHFAPTGAATLDPFAV